MNDVMTAYHCSPEEAAEIVKRAERAETEVRLLVDAINQAESDSSGDVDPRLLRARDLALAVVDPTTVDSITDSASPVRFMAAMEGLIAREAKRGIPATEANARLRRAVERGALALHRSAGHADYKGGVCVRCQAEADIVVKAALENG